MTDLYQGQITDLLDGSLKQNPEVQALAYAVQAEKQRIMLLTQGTKIEAAIDDLSEEALDALAVELRTQYYSLDIPIEKKRELIRNTFLWYKKAGTLSAVEELALAAYGECTVQEWFDYNGEPGYFRVETSQFEAVYSNLQSFLTLLQKVKRLSAHLEKVRIHSERRCGIGVGIAIQRHVTRTMYMEAVAPEQLVIGLADENGDLLLDENGDILIV